MQEHVENRLDRHIKATKHILDGFFITIEETDLGITAMTLVDGECIYFTLFVNGTESVLDRKEETPKKLAAISAMKTAIFLRRSALR